MRTIPTGESTGRRRQRVIGALLGLTLALFLPANADSMGTSYVCRMAPRGNALDESGWGLGTALAIPLVSTRETIKLRAGMEMGNLDSRVDQATELGGYVTTQNYQRIFGGVEIGRKLDARIRPHLGVDVVLLRQDVNTFFLDAALGGPQAGRSDSSTRLTYDGSAGVGIGISAKMGLDVGVRYMDGFRINVPGTDGSAVTTQVDYLQIYLGVNYRLAWPQGGAFGE